MLLHLKRRLNLGDFFRLIEDGGPKLKPAANLLQVYARQQNRELLKDFWFQDDRRTESATLALEEAASMTVMKIFQFLLCPDADLLGRPPESSSKDGKYQDCSQVLFGRPGERIRIEGEGIDTRPP